MSAGLFSLRRGVGVINDQMIKVAVRSDIKAMREEKDKAQALARREKRKRLAALNIASLFYNVGNLTL